MDQQISKDARAETTRLLLILGILIFSYTFARAVLLSVTWDESQSYHEYIKNHIVLMDKYDFMSANNHILNTLGGIFFTELFGVSEFTLRLTPLLSHLFFLFYSAKLVLQFDKKWMAASAFLIININPFLLDFFSLSRGYSISLGMMMASVYYLYRVHQHGFKTKDLLLTVFFGALAALGNLTLLNYCFVSFAVIVLMFVFSRLQAGERFVAILRPAIGKLILPFLLLAAFLCFILPISFGLRAVGAFFMGGESGLFKDTLGTIVPRLWYELDFIYWLQRITKCFFFLIFFSAAAFVFLRMRKKQATQNTHFLCSLILILFLIILSTVVQHQFLGTLFLIERTVLFLFVLLMLIFVFFLNEIFSATGKFSYVLKGTALLFCVHFLFAFNFKYVYEWKDDCESKQMLADLAKIKEAPQDKFNLCIGIPLSLESSINYYRGTERLTWLNEAFRSKGINNLNDYFFLRPSEIEQSNMDSLEIIKTYPLTKNVLARPKYPFQLRTVIVDSLHQLSNEREPFKVDAKLEYGPGFAFTVKHDWYIPNSVLSCRVEFETIEKLRANVYYIVTCENKKGVYEWKPLRLNDFCFDENERATANFTTFIPRELKQGDEIKIYLWNPDRQQFLIHSMQMKWIHYSN